MLRTIDRLPRLGDFQHWPPWRAPSWKPPVQNGAPVACDPAAVILHAHDEIALVYGPADAHRQLPTSYDFPRGE